MKDLMPSLRQFGRPPVRKVAVIVYKRDTIKNDVWDEKKDLTIFYRYEAFNLTVMCKMICLYIFYQPFKT